MKEEKILIRKLTDYVLLNAFSVESSGLYNGKAGMSLALFEVGRYLADDYIYDQAVELLQEALLSKSEDIGFENGLSGIGYVLLYLIKNNHIDADFKELFSGQCEKIIISFEKLKDNPSFILNAIRMNYFFIQMYSLYEDDSLWISNVKLIFDEIERFLSVQFSGFRQINFRGDKIRILKIFENYLKSVCICDYHNFSQTLLLDYATLYRQGRVLSQYAIAHYLSNLDVQGLYLDVIEDNKLYSSDKQDMMSIRDYINYAQITKKKDLLDINTVSCEKYILQHIPEGLFIAGYEQGISRLLCYLTNPQKILL